MTGCGRTMPDEFGAPISG